MNKGFVFKSEYIDDLNNIQIKMTENLGDVKIDSKVSQDQVNFNVEG